MGAHRQLRSTPQPYAGAARPNYPVQSAPMLANRPAPPQPYAGAARPNQPEQPPPVLANRLAPALVTTFSLALGPVIIVLVLMLFPGSGGGSFAPAESTKPVIQVLPRPTDANGRPVQLNEPLPTTAPTTR